MFSIDDCMPVTRENGAKNKILKGLSVRPRYISSMFFYDSVGSKLFEEITRLPEYYLTRIEKALLAKISGVIKGCGGADSIVEFGSGDCSKISILLAGVPREYPEKLCYIPFDVSRPAVEESSRILMKRFPGLKINAVIADFITGLGRVPPGKNRLFCFLGSTAGNMEREGASMFFRSLGNIMEQGDRLLFGVDMVKDKTVLENAYNDKKGITGKFNLNILNAANSIAGTDFDPDAFIHRAFYNEAQERVEMYLVAKRAMTINAPGTSFIMGKGEAIHTENSHKFTNSRINSLLEEAGLVIEDRFSDEKNYYSLVLARKNRVKRNA